MEKILTGSLLEIEAILLLNALSLARTKPIADRLLRGDSATWILKDMENAHSDIVSAVQTKFDVRKEIQKCYEQGIKIITLADKDYPLLLRMIPDPPLVLYVRGCLLESDRVSVALVGARKSTPYGLVHARRFGCELADAGWTVISGLAKGIDSAAHEGALSVSHGRTIAVLGCGVDVVYPAENRTLYKRIEKSGAIISEFPLGAAPLAHHFPRRNRIISGLALGTFVLEAFLRSGSLITAQQSIEQGREVFALPGRIDELTSMGTNKLIKDGATMIDSFENLNRELVEAFNKWKFKNQTHIHDLHNIIEKENSIVSSLKNNTDLTQDHGGSLCRMIPATGISFDEFMSQSSISSAEASLELIGLELERKIVRKADGLYYSLN